MPQSSSHAVTDDCAANRLRHYKSGTGRLLRRALCRTSRAPGHVIRVSSVIVGRDRLDQVRRTSRRMHHDRTSCGTTSSRDRGGKLVTSPQSVRRRQHARADLPQADRRARPLDRRAERIARPARVRIRSRKPWVFERRRLFGWKVRLVTSGTPSSSCSPHVATMCQINRVNRAVAVPSRSIEPDATRDTVTIGAGTCSDRHWRNGRPPVLNSTSVDRATRRAYAARTDSVKTDTRSLG
jgi:hypothetical protein